MEFRTFSLHLLILVFLNNHSSQCSFRWSSFTFVISDCLSDDICLSFSRQGELRGLLRYTQIALKLNDNKRSHFSVFLTVKTWSPLTPETWESTPRTMTMTSSDTTMTTRAWRSAWTPPRTGTDKHVGMTSSVTSMTRAWRSAWTPPHTGTDKHVGNVFNKQVGMTSSVTSMTTRAWRSAWTPPHTGTDNHVGNDVNKHVGNDVICYKHVTRSWRSVWTLRKQVQTNTWILTSSVTSVTTRAWRSARTPPHTGTDKHVGNDVIRYKHDDKSMEVSLDTSAYRYRQTRG